jgi:hypothetical protein
LWWWHKGIPSYPRSNNLRLAAQIEGLVIDGLESPLELAVDTKLDAQGLTRDLIVMVSRSDGQDLQDWIEPRDVIKRARERVDQV